MYDCMRTYNRVGHYTLFWENNVLVRLIIMNLIKTQYYYKHNFLTFQIYKTF